MTFKFNKKFAENNLDNFIDSVYRNYETDPTDKYYFDLSDTGWISNQELLVFTGLLKCFLDKGIDFEVKLIKKGLILDEAVRNRRIAIQLIDLWDTWKIHQITEEENHIKYFGINVNHINALRSIHKYKYSNDYKIFQRYGITPFIFLEFLPFYNDKDVEVELEKFLSLNQATNEIVSAHQCTHPFVNNTLSSIVARELYENFLDHSSESFIQNSNTFAFMSLSLLPKADERKISEDEIQERKKINFKDEVLPETKNFFYDIGKQRFKNESYIQFSFLDFGQGICKTLKDGFLKKNGSENLFEIDDSLILKYAFQHNTSRHPLFEKLSFEENPIPRGLFDLLSIVKRYGGLLIARSNYGKILYDFSNEKEIENAFSKFGNPNLYFPGTLISIYLPALSTTAKFDNSVIKPSPAYIFPNFKERQKVYVGLNQLIDKLKDEKKENLYKKLFNEIYYILNKDQAKKIIFFSFLSSELNYQITKKIIFFLLSSYDISVNNCIIIMHPPSIVFFEQINYEVLTLNSVVQKYKIHPLPFIYHNHENHSIEIKWLGLYNKEDIKRVNELLKDEYRYSIKHFNEPDNLIGNTIIIDKNGNLGNLIPSETELLEYYKSEQEDIYEFHSYIDSEINVNSINIDFESESWLEEELENEEIITDNYEIETIIERNKCINRGNENDVYFCNNNFYQSEFVDIIKLLNNVNDNDLISKMLFKKINLKLNFDENHYIFLTITSSSNKILKSFIKQNLFNTQVHKTINLESFSSFEVNQGIQNIKNGNKVIIIGDVLSTGRITEVLSEKLKKRGATLELVCVVVNTIDKNIESSKKFVNKFGEKIVSLYDYPIKKNSFDDILKDENKDFRIRLKNKNIIRINPYTNIPITFSIKETYYEDSVLLTNEEFLKYISNDLIIIKFLKFNNIIHPYFFDTEKIIKEFNIKLFHKIFNPVKNVKNLKIFYPQESDIQYLDWDKLKTNILQNQQIEFFELERFNIYDGWKFPHTTDFNEKINKNPVLLLDDGSCTGNSLFQMIDEIAFFNPSEIFLICIIGRVSDYKREFFSRLKSIKTKYNADGVTIHVYFGCIWNIPTFYLEENPLTVERKWLDDIIKLSNTPKEIKKIARKISGELKPTIERDKVYKYFPIEKASKIIRKDKLIKIRDEIGKILGYRFYTESFEYFDNIIKNYLGGEKYNEHTFEDVQILCALFLYEPYLFKIIDYVLPDLGELIRRFINSIIFEKKINLFTLSYDFQPRDIIHLFFVVYYEDNILAKFKRANDLSVFFECINEIENSSYYALYKLLRYFPLNRSELNEYNNGHLITLIETLIQNDSLPKNIVSEVKIFRSFLSTLPKVGNFESDLNEINIMYRNLTDQKNHNNSISKKFELILPDIEVLKSKYSDLKRNQILNDWNMISKFNESILTFSSSHSDFFQSWKRLIEKEEDSLSTIHGKLNELLNNLNKNSEFEKISSLLTNLYDKFIESSSDIYAIFIQSSHESFIDDFKKEFNQYRIEYNFNNLKSDFEKCNVGVPKFIIENTIFSELKSNFRHRNESKPIVVSIWQENEYLFVTIKNSTNASKKNGGGNGIIMLENLNLFPDQRIKYDNNKITSEKDGFFTQNFRFKLI